MEEKQDQKKRIGDRIKAARERLGMSQADFARALKVGQGNTSKWESGVNQPTPNMMARIAGIVQDLDKFFFLEEAGVPKEYFLGNMGDLMAQEMTDAAGRIVRQAFHLGGEQVEVESVLVPLLADAIAAGNPLTIDERDVKGSVMMGREWLPEGGHYFAVKVKGESMEPTLGDGYVAFIDVSKRRADRLVGHMVAARVGDGSTIKWLRKSRNHYTLVPQHSSPRFDVQVLGPDDDWEIIGEVVRWIGQPPPVRK